MMKTRKPAGIALFQHDCIDLGEFPHRFAWANFRFFVVYRCFPWPDIRFLPLQVERSRENGVRKCYTSQMLLARIMLPERVTPRRPNLDNSGFPGSMASASQEAAQEFLQSCLQLSR